MINKKRMVKSKDLIFLIIFINTEDKNKLMSFNLIFKLFTISNITDSYDKDNKYVFV